MMNTGRKMNREILVSEIRGAERFLAVSAYWAGVFGWFYIGVWQVLKKPVHSVILAQIAGHLSIGLLIGALIQGFLYLSLAGGIWCVGYMISEYFKESK